MFLIQVIDKTFDQQFAVLLKKKNFKMGPQGRLISVYELHAAGFSNR